MTQPTAHQFEIRISGWLEDHWLMCFDCVAVRRIEGGDTILEGQVPDQSALFGVFHAIETLGWTVVSVRTMGV